MGVKCFIVGIIFLLGCGLKKDTNNKTRFAEQGLLSVLYMQKAAECKALQEQAYCLATVRLEELIREKKETKKYAVVVDIDETVLDNSPYQAKQIVRGELYPTGWKEWVEKAVAKPIPGALAFLRRVVEKGFDIFYVSNRKEELLDATIRNLQKEGFPQVEKKHIYLRTNTSSKEGRRAKIRKTHKIVLLIGDNMGDFVSIFDKIPLDKRLERLSEVQKELGKSFIVLPNPTYGSWEGAIIDYKYQSSIDEKMEKRKKTLVTD